MAKTDFKSVDGYFASLPTATQAVLGRVRSAIRKTLPEAVEVISYQMPAYKIQGRPVIYFAGWKAHYSLYPASDRLVAAFENELAPYAVSKGTIRFPLSDPVPGGLIARLARFRANEVQEAATARKGARVSPAPGSGSSRRRKSPRSSNMTAADFRRLALSFSGAEEGSHMGAVDFRVGGRIFATLASVTEGFGNLMLTPEIQAEFVAEQPDIFVPVAGGWGRMGATHIRLAKATRDVLAGALEVAWKLRADKNASRSRQGTRRKPL